MKKILFITTLIALPLFTACEKEQTPTKEDYAILQNAVQVADTTIITIGDQGDFLIKLQKTDEIQAIYNKQKTAKFLSISDPKQYIEEGYCLLNVIPVNTMEQIGTPDNTCHYRLYCGNAKNMNYDNLYAVELCM